MVATRSRATALIFVGLLMLSSLAAITPTAQAQVAIPSATVTNVQVRTASGAPLAANQVLVPGETITFHINATGDCQGVQATPVVAATARVANDILIRGTTEPSATLVRDGATINHRGIIAVTLEGNFTGTQGRESRTATEVFTVAVTATCGTVTTLNPATLDTTETPVAIDNRAPRMPTSIPYEVFYPTGVDAQGFPLHVNVGNAGTPTSGADANVVVVGSGATVMLKDFYTDASPLAGGTVDVREYGWGTTPLALNAGNQTFNFTILDGDVNTKDWNNQTVAGAMTVRDSAGNVATAAAISLKVDNVRPTGALANATTTGFATMYRSNATRTLWNGATVTGATSVNVSWNESVIGGAATPETNDVVGAFIFAEGQAKNFTTNGTDTMFGTTTPMHLPLDVAYYPVDAGGNVGRTPTYLTFPQMDLRYGLVDGTVTQHPQFLGGRLLGPVYLNVTKDAPTMATGLATPVGVQLVRYTDTGVKTFWKVGTQGRESTGDFTQTSSWQTDPITFVRPVSATTANIVLLNFSDRTGTGNARNFDDGRYELVVNVSGPTTNASYNYSFRIDGSPPALPPMKNWTAGPDAANTTGAANLHGLDGNPFRVAVNATEWRGLSRDSGIRNVTVELVSQDLSQVVRLADGSSARIDFTLDQCGDAGLFSHCFDLTDIDPSKYVAGTPEHARAVRNLAVYTQTGSGDGWNTTANSTWFSGWFNTTWPGAPVGTHKIRVLAYDQSGAHGPVGLYGGTGLTTTTAAAAYQVVPRVAVQSSIGTPLVDGDQLYATALAAQDLHASDVPGGMFCLGVDGKPEARLCPVENVRILVSNSNAASLTTNPGTSVTATPLPHQDASTDTAPVFTWSFTNRSANGTGWLDHSAARQWDLFKYTPNVPLTIPGTIDRTKDIYVRAEAIRVVNGVEVVGRSEWVKATTGTVSDVLIRSPGQDWSVNRSGTLPLNVTFDRKTNPSTAAVMHYEIFDITSGTPQKIFHSNAVSADLNAGNVQAKFKLNWTSTLADHNRTGTNKSFLPGAYLLKVYVNESGAPLSELWRNFTVLPGDPYILLDAAQPSDAIASIGPGLYQVRPRFDIAVSANHSFANVTSVDQLKFTLERGTTRYVCTFAGGVPVCPSGTGFTVARLNQSVLAENRQSSHWNFTVTMPTAAIDRETYTLNITLDTDGNTTTPGAPWNLTHAAVHPRLTLDAERPTAEVQLQLTNATGGVDAPKYALTGTIEHAGSSLPALEVFVQDLDDASDRWLSFSEVNATLVATQAAATPATSSLVSAYGKSIRQVEVVRRNATLVDWTLRAADRPVYSSSGVLQERLYFPDIALPGDHNLSVTVRVAGTAQAPVVVRYDALAPVNSNAGAVNVRQLQDPSRSTGIVIVGSAQDTGSGVKTVEVRLVDLSTNSTYVFAGADVTQTVGAITDNWATSDKIDLSVRNSAGAVTESRFAEQVNLTRRGSTSTWDWFLYTGNRPVYQLVTNPDGSTGYSKTGLFWRDFELSRTTMYRVDVRVTDRLNQVTDPVRSFQVQFDPTGPTLIGPVTGPTTVDWHGKPNEATLAVQATDNYCLKRVTLKGTSPSGVNVSADMTKTSGPECSLNGRATTWSLALSKAPQMTNEIGEYLYWYEAEDLAGHVTEVAAVERSFRVRVRDNWPAEVLYTPTFNPPIAGAGLPVRVTAEILENQGIAKVMLIVRNSSTNLEIANGTMRPDPERPVGPTGSGFYVADLSTDLNLTLDIGTYLIEVRPFDVNWNRTAAPGPTCSLQCPSKFANLRVVEEDAPIVRLDAPAGASVVNGTPTFKLSVLHRGIQTSGIQVRAGPAGNLSAVTPTFTEIRSAQNVSQGYSLTFTPGQLAEQVNYTVTVTATSTRTGFTNSSTYTFSVDAAPPTVAANVTGTTSVANVTYAVGATRVNVTAADNLTGPAVIKYTVNGGAEQTYGGPITPAGDDGVWTLQYWAVDGAGNVAAKQSLTLNLDKSGPRIAVAQHGDEVTLTVTDAGVGLDETNVTVNYAYGDAVSFSSQKAEKVTGNLFKATLPGRAAETGLRYWFSARDLLGNTGTNFSAAQPYAIRRNETSQPPQNVPPTISITSPLPNAEATGTLELRWIAEDPEGAPLTISITVRDPAPGTLLVPAGENSGLYRVNLASYQPGEYTIVVTASDGERSASDEVTFRVPGAAPPPDNPIAIELPLPDTVEAGAPANFAVKINATGKTIAQATYRIVRDNQTIASGQLRSQAGAYAGTYTPNAPGDYRVVVDVLYADGTTARREAGAFNVPGDTDGEVARVFPVSLMALSALAVVVVALAAYGAFGRWKK